MKAQSTWLNKGSFKQKKKKSLPLGVVFPLINGEFSQNSRMKDGCRTPFHLTSTVIVSPEAFLLSLVTNCGVSVSVQCDVFATAS